MDAKQIIDLLTQKSESEADKFTMDKDKVLSAYINGVSLVIKDGIESKVFYIKDHSSHNYVILDELPDSPTGELHVKLASLYTNIENYQKTRLLAKLTDGL